MTELFSEITINDAASIAGLVSLTDVALKYSKLVDDWKDAPASIRRMKDLHHSLQRIIIRLEQLQELSDESLKEQGLSITGFRTHMKALGDLVDGILSGKDKVETWKRTKWTLKSNGAGCELHECKLRIPEMDRRWMKSVYCLTAIYEVM